MVQDLGRIFKWRCIQVMAILMILQKHEVHEYYLGFYF